MSEVRLNLVDGQSILTGCIHGHVADSCVAALSAEPETISELAAALARYIKREDGATPFPTFHCSSEIDPAPWDAGLVIIDLAARIVATESSYSQPQPEGEVHYHDGRSATDIPVLYRLPDDWLFVSSFEGYRWSHDRRREQRANNPPLDTRAILYGPPLLDHIENSVSRLSSDVVGSEIAIRSADYNPANDEEPPGPLAKEIRRIHADWLMTPREDLRNQSPRDVLLAKQNFIDFDLHTRALQWSFLGEGPPCLALDSFAYRFAGFGTHEWVVYYDLVRHLLWTMAFENNAPAIENNAPTIEMESVPSAVAGGYRIDVLLENNAAAIEMESVPSAVADGSCNDVSQRGSSSTGREGTAPSMQDRIAKLDSIKTTWLESPQAEYDGRIPAIIIENERKRLPQTMSAAEIMIDENCDWCRMSAMEAEMGFGPTFWHLDGCNMEDEFVFSSYRTLEEWEAEQRRYREFTEQFNREQAEKKRGEIEGSFDSAESVDREENLDLDQRADSEGNLESEGSFNIWESFDPEENPAREACELDLARRWAEKRQWDEDQERLARGECLEPDQSDEFEELF